MDALTSLVTALAAGAAAALKRTAEQAVKDSYTALKGLIQRKYAQVSLDQLEANPSSKNRRGVVEEDLVAAGTDQDTEVLQQAQTLLETIQHQAPETAAAIGVDPHRHRRGVARDPARHCHRGRGEGRRGQAQR